MHTYRDISPAPSRKRQAVTGVVLTFALLAGATSHRPISAAMSSVADEGTSLNFVDPLDRPAIPSALAERTQLTAVSSSQGAVVVAGWRGHILRRQDGVWHQAEVPVSVDLTAVRFPNDGSTGWAVGHGGVILRSDDGGQTWRKQADGNSLAQSGTAHYASLIPDASRPGVSSAADMSEISEESMSRYFGSGAIDFDEASADDQVGDLNGVMSGEDALARAQADFQLNTANGPNLPWLDVWFDDHHQGWVVGSFNMIMKTTDGGKSWTPVLEEVDNPEGLHLTAINRIGDKLFIASERGVVFRRDDDEQRFRQIQTPYQGSFFGIVGAGPVIYAYGLRGNIYRSTDEGETWREVETGIATSITGASPLNDGGVVFISQGGEILELDAEGERVSEAPGLESRSSLAAVKVDGGHALIVVGARGVQVLPRVAGEG